MRAIARHLGARIDERAFERELLMGYEDTREGARRPSPRRHRSRSWPRRAEAAGAEQAAQRRVPAQATALGSRPMPDRCAPPQPGARAS